MRRSDREIKDFDEILKVLEKCDVCRLAFNDGDYPYIVPMSFALEYDGSEASLYFHSANGQALRRIGLTDWFLTKKKASAPLNTKALQGAGELLSLQMKKKRCAL